MSVETRIKRTTVPDIVARKGGEPLVCLTTYHAHTARLIDPYVDLLLVGDSLGMVMYGMETTLGVTLDMMIAHGAAVVRGAERALVVVDMPFGSYEESPEVAFRHACRVIKETGCTAVKLEGGERMAETVRYLVLRGVPVMGHIGLTPQNVNVAGGFRVTGRTEDTWPALEADARALVDAGVFAMVLEGMAEPLAVRITHQVSVPTIGIGASPACDGQILVTEDMLGLSPKAPLFVKEFASLGAAIAGAAEAYGAEVRARKFPSSTHVYGMEESSSDSSSRQVKKNSSIQ
ncbi:MAG: 3-methyl-2-oxobutanoate hydroxymethyltransferase [Parvularculales bacterium]